MNQVLLNRRLVLKTGDITREDSDAIVNAANSTLLGGGGVDGAIHRSGGPIILQECREIRQKNYPNGLPTGAAVITSGGNLPARFVIHTVGPIYGQEHGDEHVLLAKAYQNCLEIAKGKQLKTISLPAISTGVYSFPKNLAAKIAFQTVSDFLSQNQFPETVNFIFFKEEDLTIFLKSIQTLLSPGLT